MASFTDAISQFNPYVQQLPIDAMVKVGMQKQAQYDQGIQKIQSYIDSIAGLEVVNDADKTYLQSKLNELGGKLKTVAGGDFSNYQLVNSVGGMATQIVKDPVIRTAISSTAMYKRGLEDMRLAQKEGKSSPSNEWIFLNDSKKWLDSKTPGTEFKGNYAPYTNWKKNGIEIIKSLTGDSTITDDAFTVDSKGNVVLSDAIVRKKIAGLTPDKIKQALLVGLSPADFKQMEIDGRYNYSNKSPEEFTQDVIQSYSNKKAPYLEKRKAIENAIDTTPSVPEKTKLKEQLDNYDKFLKNLDDEYHSLIDGITSATTPEEKQAKAESAKARLFTLNSINGFGTSFSNTEIAQTYEANHMAEMRLKREIKEQEWKTFILNYQQSERQFEVTSAYKQEELRLKGEANEIARNATKGYGGLGTPVDQSQLPTFSIPKIVGEIEQKENELNQSKNLFLQQKGKDESWLEQQRISWEKSPKSVDPTIAKYFTETAEKQNSLDADKKMVLDINKQAVEKYGTVDQFIPKNAPNINLHFDSGTVSFSPKEIVMFNEKFKNYSITEVAGSAPSLMSNLRTVWYDEKAQKDLSAKEKILYDIYKKSHQRKDLSQGEQLLMNIADNYRKTINVQNSKLINNINKFTSDEVQKRVTNMQGVSYAIPVATTSQKTSIATVLTQFADLADKQKGGLANSPNWNSETARKIANDNDAKYSITVVEGTERSPAMYKISATGKDGNIEFNITPEQKTNIFGDKFEATPSVRAIRPIQEQIRKLGGYSTALEPGTSNHENAYLQSNSFRNVSIYGVKANVITPDNGNTYSIRLSIYDPISKQWKDDIPYPSTMISEEQIAPAISGLNDAAIYQMLNEKTPTAADLQKLKQASQKPF